MTHTEWLEWRRLGLGSSDYATIMGISEWQTLLQLYESKIGPVDEKTSWVMEQGIKMEPRIRALYEFHHNISLPPALLIMDGMEFMRVSLDGRSECGETICEIKFMAKALWERAKFHNEAPAKYMPQMQGQLLVSRAKKCIFLAYPFSKELPEVLDINKLAIVEVLPDSTYQSELLSKCQKFWYDHVVKGVAPKPKEDDYKPLVGIPEVVKEWTELDEMIDELEKRRDVLRQQILEHAEKSGATRLLCAGVKLSRLTRAGNINYKSVPQLSGVDLEPYRGKEITYWKMARE